MLSTFRPRILLAALVLGAGLLAPAARAHALYDYGDRNAARIAALLTTSAGRQDGFHMVQIGDSHTAGDYFTDYLRTELQQRLGDGGIGWAMPMYASGQRLARVGYEEEGWELLTSRNGGEADYPFGGMIARGTGVGGQLTIKTKSDDSPRQRIVMVISQAAGDPPLHIIDADSEVQDVKAKRADGSWSDAAFTARLPFIVTTEGSPNTRIGGWWMTAERPGAIVSAVGINGSELAQWDRWRAGWMDDLALGKPDLIALAYGTNEAFQGNLDPQDFQRTLETAVDRLRAKFPRSAILIIGAPESLSSFKGGACGQRAPSLNLVQQAQRAVAREKHTLYWDWQQAMGGGCSMRKWVNQKLARKDGVHFSQEGYERAAGDLLAGLLHLRGAAAR
ncbi:SGNH/GDSL hydrolase family protein [Achromobacter aloeverae]